MVTSDNTPLCSFPECERKQYVAPYCSMHYQRHKSGRDMAAETRRPNGSGSYDASGYLRFNGGGMRHKGEHVIVAEKALGKPLPAGAIVHHVNEDPADNSHENLVICPDNAYHRLIHRRMRAMATCGHADWSPCIRCKRYDAPDNLSGKGRNLYHNKCANEYSKKMKARHAKPRHVRRGAEVGTSKLTEAIVRLILADERTQRVVANEYGVSQRMIYNIKHRFSWRHVR